MIILENKISSISLVLLGIFLLIISIFYLSKSPLIFIAEIFFSIFLITIGIFNHKELITIILGGLLLILVIFWNSIYTASILETFSILISSLFFIIIGAFLFYRRNRAKTNNSYLINF